MGRKPPIRCPCNPLNPIRVNQKHITQCLLFDRVWTLLAIDWNTYKDELIEYLSNETINSSNYWTERRLMKEFRTKAAKVNLKIIQILHELFPQLKPEELENSVNDSHD
jgi:hypothetical protein